MLDELFESQPAIPNIAQATLREQLGGMFSIEALEEATLRPLVPLMTAVCVDLPPGEARTVEWMMPDPFIPDRTAPVETTLTTQWQDGTGKLMVHWEQSTQMETVAPAVAGIPMPPEARMMTLSLSSTGDFVLDGDGWPTSGTFSSTNRVSRPATPTQTRAFAYQYDRIR
ncbi:MAG: hypothetical protein AAFV53_28570 [Myxococcota bacterium]